MPSTPLCGGFTIGVDISDPNTPPFEIVKVPPWSSSGVILFDWARLPKSAIVPSTSANDRRSALRTTGTTSPLGVETATPTS